jgi:hypothetical protein
MWGIRIAAGGAVFAFAVLSAAAQSAGTGPGGPPLSLLNINQTPPIEQPAKHVDKAPRSTPVKPPKTVVSASSRPAPTHAAPRAHGADTWPAAYADTPDPMAFPLPSPPPPASAKSRAERNRHVSDDTQVVRPNEVNSFAPAVYHQNEPAHLITPSAIAQPQVVSAAMLSTTASLSSVPAIVATPELQGDSSIGGASWMAKALAGVLAGGLLGGAVAWFLIRPAPRRNDLAEEVMSAKRKVYNWASAYNETPAYDDPPAYDEPYAYNDRWSQ